MKRKLLKLTVLLLCMMGGANAVWATIVPTLDVSFRAKDATSASGWNDNYSPRAASETYNDFELSYRNGLFVLQKYTVEDLANVTSLTLMLYGTNGPDALAVWAYKGDTDWTSETAAATIIENVKTTVGFYPNSESGTYSSDYLLKDGGVNTTNGKLYTISGTALTTLKGAATDNTFTLLITNKTSALLNKDGEKRHIYTSGYTTDEYKRPAIYATRKATLKVDGGSTEYDNMAAAVTAAVTADKDAEIEVYGDEILTARQTWTRAKTLTITPKRDITITGNNTNFMYFLTNETGKLSIGNGSNKITFEGQGNTYSANITKREKASPLYLTNVEFQNYNLNSTWHLAATNESGNQIGNSQIFLEDVAITNCSNPKDGYIGNYSGTNDNVYLKGSLNVTGSEGAAIYTPSRIRLGELEGSNNYNSFTSTNTIKINWGGLTDLGTVVIVKAASEAKDCFDLTSTDKGFYWNSSNGDLQIGQAYTLAVTDAGAATLVLPYATTIPSGVSAYTLTHTDGSSTVSASAVETTLDADKPVLINAAAGSYKFVCTSNDATIKTSGTAVQGALTGVYESTSLNSTSNPNTYILRKQDDVVGFFKVGTTARTVAANRAYLTATNVPDAGVHGLSIVFDDDDVTAIESVNREPLIVNQYYDLGGRRVEKPTKGLYIVNGKKVIIK